MKVRFTLLGAALLACLTAFAAMGEKTVKGRGAVGIELDHSEEGSTRLLMALYVDVKLGEQASGRLVFAGDDHEHGRGDDHASASFGPSYPGRVVHLHTFESVKIENGEAVLEGMGSLSGESVRIWAKIVDKGTSGDHFEVKCTRFNGEVAYARHGDLVSGDIVLGVN